MLIICFSVLVGVTVSALLFNNEDLIYRLYSNPDFQPPKILVDTFIEQCGILKFDQCEYLSFSHAIGFSVTFLTIPIFVIFSHFILKQMFGRHVADNLVIFDIRICRTPIIYASLAIFTLVSVPFGLYSSTQAGVKFFSFPSAFVKLVYLIFGEYWFAYNLFILGIVWLGFFFFVKETFDYFGGRE